MQIHPFWFVGLIAISLCAVGCQRNSSPAASDRETAGSELTSETLPAVKVQTVSLQTKDLRYTTTQPATVAPLHKATIRARVAGYIREVKADIGDVVEQGAPLVTIDVPELDAQRAMLQAEIERRRAEERKAEQGVQLAAANVTAAEAGLQQAKAELQSVDASLAAAEAELKRTQDLVERRSVEPRLLDEVRERRDAQVARKAALQSAVTSAQAGIAVAQAQKEAAQAEQLAMQADTVIAERRLDELEVQLQFATITAPFTGVIAVRHAEPGDLVQPDTNAAALFELIQVDKVRIHVSVPERDAAAINRGDAMRVQFPSFANAEVLEVEVTRTTGQLDPATRMMRVEAEVDNKDGRLLPGMFGQATIELDVRSDVAVLPARAVRFTDTGDAFVYAVNDSKVQVLPVVTGADDGRTIEIVSGLNDQQTFVDAHRQRFEAGQTVEVLN